MNDREVMRLALEALENGRRVRACEGGTKYQPPLEEAAITALRAALEQREPRRKWQGLTNLEKKAMCAGGPVHAPHGVVARSPLAYRQELEGVALMAVRKAEAALKEKNQ
jgi:hypothetical protein